MTNIDKFKNLEKSKSITFRAYTGNLITEKDYKKTLEWEKKQPEWQDYVKSMKN